MVICDSKTFYFEIVLALPGRCRCYVPAVLVLPHFFQIRFKLSLLSLFKQL